MAERATQKTSTTPCKVNNPEDCYGPCTCGLDAQYAAWDENSTLACTPEPCGKCGGRGTELDHNGERYVEVGPCPACNKFGAGSLGVQVGSPQQSRDGVRENGK